MLEIAQSGIPLVPRPFERIGELLSVSESDVIARLERLKSESLIRQIGAIFDSAMLGYRGALAAFAVEEARLDEVARAVSRHEGVSHCYSRDSRLNLWFTITVGPDANLEREFDALAAIEGVNEARMLPALKVYKIGVFLPMSDHAHQLRTPTPSARSTPEPLSETEKSAVRALQADLPLVAAPFAVLAAEAGMTEDTLLECGRALLARGVMRKYAAVLRHREAGFRANAMVCWHAPADRIDDIGAALAEDPAVSHCYHRPNWPGWPYQLYTMVHARDEADLEQAVQRLERASGIRERAVLRTLTEHKKSRVSYL